MIKWIVKHKYSVIALLVYWLCAGLIPLSVVLSEFGYRTGFAYAKFYSPLFFYPVIFGLITVYLFLRPFFFLLRLRSPQFLGFKLRHLSIFVLTISFLVTAVEVSGRPAIWEVKKSAIEASIQELTKDGTISEIDSWDVLFDHFSNHPKIPSYQDFYIKEEYPVVKAKIEKTRAEFSTIIEHAAQNRSNWSMTRYTYWLSFFIQQLAMLLLFVTISFLSMPKLQERIERPSLIKRPSNNGEESSLREKLSLSNQLVLLSCALTFSLFWFYMRLPFDIDKSDLYGTSLISNSASTTAIGVLYVLAALYVTLTLRFRFDEKFQVVYNIVIAFLGVMGTIQSAQTGGNFLGSDASPQNYIICVITLAIVLFPWYVMYNEILE